MGVEHPFRASPCPGVHISVESLSVERTITLRDRKGADIAEWQEDLRVREF